MRLARLRIRNFRCFKEEIVVDFDDITALIGKNDAGKSSIMDALDIFLNEGSPDKHDASKRGEGKDLTIICEFDGLPEKVVIDEDYETGLKKEYLLNSGGRLEIHKTYSGHTKDPKCTCVAAFAVHPTADNVKDLLQLKNAELKKRAQDLKINLDGIDQKINAQLRERIREHIHELKLAPALVQLNENNAKDVWIGLRKYMPFFALFKSDRSSTDQDSEAQDPLKAAIKEAIKAKEAELSSIMRFVECEVKKIADSTLRKIKEMDPTLASQLNPQFVPPKWDQLFKASITGDEDIPINKRGSGIRRLILLSFFRAKSEQLIKENEHSSVIYGIEEPETSQHPNNQRMLLRALEELSEEFQVIISTHTPMLARSLPDKKIRFVSTGKNNKREILVGSDSTNALFTKSLGVLPDNNVKLFIGVEGKHDITFLQAISKILVSEKIEEAHDLEKMEIDGEVIFFPCGGTNLILWASRLGKLNRPEFHLCDRDVAPPKAPKYEKYTNEVNLRAGCKAKSTQKKEMENYLHKDAIVEAYKECGIDIKIDKQYADFDDVPLEVAKLVYQVSAVPTKWEQLSTESQGEKISKVKKRLNSIAPRYMSLSRLKETDPCDELIGWFKDIHNLIDIDKSKK